MRQSWRTGGHPGTRRTLDGEHDAAAGEIGGSHPVRRRKTVDRETRTEEFLPWKILHWPVLDGCPALSTDPDTGGVFIVFWCHDIPLGQLAVPASQLPVSPSQMAVVMPRIIAPTVGYHTVHSGFELAPPIPPEHLLHTPPNLSVIAELSRPLRLLAEKARDRMRVPASLRVSVVLCTRNRPHYLERALCSIVRLVQDPDQVIVVDNDPESGVTLPVVSKFPGVEYVPEPRPGLSAARNAGVRASKGEIIAFTDDDVLAHPHWLTAMCRTFSNHGDVMAATGLVLPAELATAAQYAFQSSSLWDYRPVEYDRKFFDVNRRLGVPAWRVGAGANMAFRREAFDLVGAFDERLGAGTSGCSEDSELWYRLLARNQKCRYDPCSVVFHYHRRDWLALRHQMHQYMKGHVAALMFQFEKCGQWGNVRRAFAALPWNYFKLSVASAKRAIGRRIYGRGSEPPSLPLSDQILGVLAGYEYYLRHRRSPAHVHPCAAADRQSPRRRRA